MVRWRQVIRVESSVLERPRKSPPALQSGPILAPRERRASTHRTRPRPAPLREADTCALVSTPPQRYRPAARHCVDLDSDGVPHLTSASWLRGGRVSLGHPAQATVTAADSSATRKLNVVLPVVANQMATASGLALSTCQHVPVQCDVCFLVYPELTAAATGSAFTYDEEDGVLLATSPTQQLATCTPPALPRPRPPVVEVRRSHRARYPDLDGEDPARGPTRGHWCRRATMDQFGITASQCHAAKWRNCRLL